MSSSPEFPETLTAVDLVVVTSAFGSDGDVGPMLALARETRRVAPSTTRVVFVSNPKFEPPEAHPFGDHEKDEPRLEFIGVGTEREYEELLNNSEKRRNKLTLPHFWMGHLQEHFRVLKKVTGYDVPSVSRKEKVVAVTHPLDLAARCFEEYLLLSDDGTSNKQITCVTAVLSPAMLRCEDVRSPVFGGCLGGCITKSPKLAWSVRDLMVDVAFAKKLNAFRRQLLKTTQTTYVPVTGVYKDWFLCHGGVLAMWPAWFGGPHPDWPKTVAQLGFPGEGGGKKTVSTEASSPSTTQVTRFLDSAVRDETRVWVFMVSSGNPPHSASFFKAAVCAAAKAGVHAVLLTKHERAVPSLEEIERLRKKNAPKRKQLNLSFLPRTKTIHVPHCDLRLVLSHPGVAGVVHSGGVGTTAVALTTGTPQIIVPNAWDQHDNAARAKRLGVATEISVKSFSAGRAGKIARSMHALDVKRGQVGSDKLEKGRTLDGDPTSWGGTRRAAKHVLGFGR